MNIKINFPFGKYEEGEIVEVKDQAGIPVDYFWRKRLKDSKLDKCCEVVKESQPKREAKAKVDKPKKVNQES